MNIENRVYPDGEQIATLQAPGHDGPIVMVNLLKFRPKARYKDGRDPDISGREAYDRYGAAVEPLIKGVGGRVVYAGNITFLMLGRADSLWDEVALAMYPSRAAFLQMMFSPEMQAIADHREAGLEGQLNIETIPVREF